MDRYQDYVIKNGMFVGKFEEMYQKFDDPWYQKKYSDISYINYASLVSIKKYSVNSILEVGCGLGATTNFLKRCIPNLNIAGLDISETAIQKATQTYPDIQFYVGNLLEYSRRNELHDYEAILLAHVMWYILEDLDKIINNFNKFYSGQLVMINETFYKDGIQEYGANYFTTFDEMCNYLSWNCLEKIVDESPKSNSIGVHAVFRI